MKRVVISDVHLGSKYCKYEDLLHFLKNETYDELILAGDIFDLVKVPIFDQKTSKILEAIDYSKKIIYIPGNHDASFKGFFNQNFFGIKILETYEFVDNGRKFRIQHGDQYDKRGIVRYHTCMSVLSILHHFLETILPFNLTSLWTQYEMKRRKLRRIWDMLKWNDDVDVFIMGHLHVPEAVIWINKDGIIKTYINIGDWVESKTYVTIINGETRLKKYEQDYHNKIRN